MTVPSRSEAASILLSLDPPEWHLRHSRAVAEIATFLAARAARQGVALDRTLVETAALLHDVDKALPDDGRDDHLPHGDGGARWLTEGGHAELAEAVRWHPVGRLIEPGAEWLLDADPANAPEVRIVAYADKRAGQRLETLAARFAGWERRYPVGSSGWDARDVALARERAERLETIVCGWCAISPGDLRRVRWTGHEVPVRSRRGRAA